MDWINNLDSIHIQCTCKALLWKALPLRQARCMLEMMDSTTLAREEVHMYISAWRNACKEIKTNSGNQLNGIGYTYQCFAEKYEGGGQNWDSSI